MTAEEERFAKRFWKQQNFLIAEIMVTSVMAYGCMMVDMTSAAGSFMGLNVGAVVQLAAIRGLWWEKKTE